jgi:hypothetical protein
LLDLMVGRRSHVTTPLPNRVHKVGALGTSASLNDNRDCTRRAIGPL